VSESEGLVDVEYCGEYELWFDDRASVTILQDLLLLKASPEVAPTLRSFTYRTEAVLAANGTYSIVIDGLFTGDRPLPRLCRLVLDQAEGEHGYQILASARNGGDGWYEEAGVLADLVARAPALQELVTPSPPSGAFFHGPSHPLRSLDVDSDSGTRASSETSLAARASRSRRRSSKITSRSSRHRLHLDWSRSRSGK
jgi:hypothetical protein